MVAKWVPIADLAEEADFKPSSHLGIFRTLVTKKNIKESAHIREAAAHFSFIYAKFSNRSGPAWKLRPELCYSQRSVPSAVK